MAEVFRRTEGLFLFLFLFVFFIKPVFAGEVVINEILPNPSTSNDSTEYIELYNQTESDIDLANWVLDDIENGGSSTFTIQEIIPKKGFLVFYKDQTRIALNNSGGDDVRLINQDGKQVDSIHYNSTKTDVAIGRVPDGSDTTVELVSSSPNASNGQPPSPTSPPSPTPTKLPTPTKTPAPTKIPILTKTPTPSKTPTSTPVPKPSATSVLPPSSNSRILAPSTKKEDDPDITLSEAILGEYIASISAAPTVTATAPTSKPTGETKVLGSFQNNLSKVFIGIGVVMLIGCGILAFKNWRKENT